MQSAGRSVESGEVSCSAVSPCARGDGRRCYLKDSAGSTPQALWPAWRLALSSFAGTPSNGINGRGMGRHTEQSYAAQVVLKVRCASTFGRLTSRGWRAKLMSLLHPSTDLLQCPPCPKQPGGSPPRGTRTE